MGVHFGKAAAVFDERSAKIARRKGGMDADGQSTAFAS